MKLLLFLSLSLCFAGCMSEPDASSVTLPCNPVVANKDLVIGPLGLEVETTHVGPEYFNAYYRRTQWGYEAGRGNLAVTATWDAADDAQGEIQLRVYDLEGTDQSAQGKSPLTLIVPPPNIAGDQLWRMDLRIEPVSTSPFETQVALQLSSAC